MAWDLAEACRRTLSACMGVRPAEEVTVVTDTATRDVGEALAAAALELEAYPVLAIMMPRRINGDEPPAAVAAAMKASTVLVMATKVSLSHTAARKEASTAGARAASMPGVTADMMTRTMGVDYGEVAVKTKALCERLHNVRTLRLTCARGTDMALNVHGLEFGADVGLYNFPGAFGNLPAGEACAGPNLRDSSGVAFFDGSFAGLGFIRDPIRIEFEHGLAVAIGGGADADALGELIAPFGESGKVLAEIGIGTHPTARLTGAVLEDEKIRGSVHLALGNNVGFGGTNDVKLHLDGVIMKPTLVTDGGDVLIRDGVATF